MTNSDKAKRAPVVLGSLEIEGFQMPDGSYRMSQLQAAECIGTTPQNASNFLRSKAFKALQGAESTDQSFGTIEVESSQQATGGTRINALPLEVVWAFWLYQCSRGNKQAYNLLAALGTETLERRFDAAFGVQRSEADYNARLAERVTRAEFNSLAEAYAEPELLREHVARLEQQLRDNGIEPWQLPPHEE